MRASLKKKWRVKGGLFAFKFEVQQCLVRRSWKQAELFSVEPEREGGDEKGKEKEKKEPS